MASQISSIQYNGYTYKVNDTIKVKNNVMYTSIISSSGNTINMLSQCVMRITEIWEGASGGVAVKNPLKLAWVSGPSGSYNGGGFIRLDQIVQGSGGTPINYRITYKANGGSGADQTQTVAYMSNFSAKGTIFSRTGYTLEHWYIDGDTSDTWALNASGVYGWQKNITMYASWKIITHTYSFDANGGSGAPAAQTKTYGVHFTFPSQVPTWANHRFLGWQSDKTSGLYQPGQQYVNLPDEDITFEAAWELITYTVAYNANGGSGAPEAQTKISGQTLTLSSQVPTRTGYTFQYWQDKAPGTPGSGEARQYDPGGSYTIDADVTLYAVWKVITLTVNFDAVSNGGNTTEPTRKVNYGDTIGTLPVAIKQYYKFVGWFTEKVGGVQISADQVITSNTTYYAQFVIDATLHEYHGGQWIPEIVFEYHDGQWQKAFAVEQHNGQWQEGVGG